MAEKINLLKYKKEDSGKDIILSPEHAAALARERKARGISTLQEAAPGVIPSLTPTEQSEKAKQPPMPDSQTNVIDSNMTGVKQPNLADAFKDLENAYRGLGQQEQSKLTAAYESLGTTINTLNEGFQQQMSEAKDKAEKDRTRAEWASIASMLAKNVVGFGAALHGINPQAMAYETMDWGKRIADINQNMNTELSLLREQMRDKVNEAKMQVAGKKEAADIGLRGRMAELDARSEMLRAQLREEGDTQRAREKTASSEEMAAMKAGQVTTKLEPPDLGNVFTKKKGEKDSDVIARVMAAGAKYGVSPQEIQAEIDKTDTGTLGFGKGDDINTEGQQAIINLFMNKYKETTTRRDSTGQAVQPVVQSGGIVRMFKDGKPYNIPADKVAAARAKGYTTE
jgi:hypothetical protein